MRFYQSFHPEGSARRRGVVLLVLSSLNKLLWSSSPIANFTTIVKKLETSHGTR